MDTDLRDQLVQYSDMMAADHVQSGNGVTDYTIAPNAPAVDQGEWPRDRRNDSAGLAVTILLVCPLCDSCSRTTCDLLVDYVIAVIGSFCQLSDVSRIKRSL